MQRLAKMICSFPGLRIALTYMERIRFRFCSCFLPGQTTLAKTESDICLQVTIWCVPMFACFLILDEMLKVASSSFCQSFCRENLMLSYLLQIKVKRNREQSIRASGSAFTFDINV